MTVRRESKILSKKFSLIVSSSQLTSRKLV